MKTLAELKAENATAEPEAVEEAPQVEAIEEEEVVEVEEVEETEQVDAETSEESETKSETEAWMQVEEEEVEVKFTDSDVGAAKRNLRAKLEKKHESELDVLRKEIEALKSSPSQAATQPAQAKPKREDYYDAEDPDEAYMDALVEYRLSSKDQAAQQQASQSEQQRKVDEFKAQVEAKVDEHYNRAAELTKTSGISADVYRQADQNVRQAVESVMPNMGDGITDALIAKIGNDSEKVVYFLGRNKAKLLEFEKALRSDTTGIEAAMMLGEIKRDLTSQTKRKSNAPTPAPSLQGNESTSPKSAGLLRKYKEAHNSNNAQKAFEIKRQAKAAGVNTREW